MILFTPNMHPFELPLLARRSITNWPTALFKWCKSFLIQMTMALKDQLSTRTELLSKTPNDNH